MQVPLQIVFEHIGHSDLRILLGARQHLVSDRGKLFRLGQPRGLFVRGKSADSHNRFRSTLGGRQKATLRITQHACLSTPIFSERER